MIFPKPATGRCPISRGWKVLAPGATPSSKKSCLCLERFTKIGGNVPATSQAQQRLFGMALAVKRGKKVAVKNPAVRRIAETLSSKKIHDFAATKGPYK